MVDTFGDELFLDVISPSTDTPALGRRHLDDPASPLGRMMRDLDVPTLGQLSTMIPARPRSKMWPLVYRDLCEWAVLYDLVCYERWGSDTLIIRDGLLRSTIFAQDQFVRVYGLMKAAVERTRRERNRDVFLVGLAKHSRIIERYRLAMAVEGVFPAGQPCYASVPLELQVKVYDWPEYVWSPEDDRADSEKPKTNMGAMYLVRFGRQSYDPVWTVDLPHFQAERAQQIFGSLLADAGTGCARSSTCASSPTTSSASCWWRGRRCSATRPGTTWWPGTARTCWPNGCPAPSSKAASRQCRSSRSPAC